MRDWEVQAIRETAEEAKRIASSSKSASEVTALNIDRVSTELTGLTTNVSSTVSTVNQNEGEIETAHMRMDAIMKGTIVWLNDSPRDWWESEEKFIEDLPTNMIQKMSSLTDRQGVFILKLPIGHRKYKTKEEAEGAKVLRGGA